MSQTRNASAATVSVEFNREKGSAHSRQVPTPSALHLPELRFTACAPSARANVVKGLYKDFPSLLLFAAAIALTSTLQADDPATDSTI